MLIGPVSDDPSESVSTVNRAFMAGLGDKFRFIVQRGDRQFGLTRQGRLNPVNAGYFAGHLSAWIWSLMRCRPQAAHYAINSGWALEKSLLFLKLARLMGVRTLGHLHSGSFIDFWNGLSPWRKRSAAREIRRLDGMVVMSEGWRHAVLTAVGLPGERLFVVHNPLDPEFEAAALRMPAERNGNLVLSLGVMGRAKGVLDILEAAEAVARQRVQFEVCLAGPEREPGIRRLVLERTAAADLSEQVAVTDAVWAEEKARLFAKASIFLLPSYYENFPLVLLEAAAAGMAIITTPVGAIPEILQDGVSALFVQPGNSKQIAHALNRFLRNPLERTKFGQAARQRFQAEFARTKIMASMASVYHSILASPKD